jgi:hypothetical protein
MALDLWDTPYAVLLTLQQLIRIHSTWTLRPTHVENMHSHSNWSKPFHSNRSLFWNMNVRYVGVRVWIIEETNIKVRWNSTGNNFFHILIPRSLSSFPLSVYTFISFPPLSLIPFLLLYPFYRHFSPRFFSFPSSLSYLYLLLPLTLISFPSLLHLSLIGPSHPSLLPYASS